MTDLRKAAEMALEALVKQHEWMARNDGMFQIPSRKAIEALRQALAMERFSEVNQEIEEALKQPKREWVGLNKDDVDSWELPDTPTVFEFAQFIESKLKEKNT